MNEKAVATINMSFDNGSFKKGKAYNYRKDPDHGLVYITTEEGKEQDLLYVEFDLFFEVLAK